MDTFVYFTITVLAGFTGFAIGGLTLMMISRSKSA